MNNEEARYGGVAMFYHWAMVVLVVIVGTLGLLHDSWPHATQAKWINMHADRTCRLGAVDAASCLADGAPPARPAARRR